MQIFKKIEDNVGALLKVFAAIIGVFFLLTGCSEESAVKEDFLLRVNDYSITSEEVDSSLKIEAELDSNFYPSEDTRTEYVKGLIQSQLLIQEAKKQQLDQRELFRQTIQRYWESTLIRDLLADKGEQLRKTTLVTKEEIEAYYQENKEFLPEGTLEELWSELIVKVTDLKVNARLAAWIEELKADATIQINDPELASKINGN
ncbi:SurA N-terminal domain-containing protein [Desulforhopalus sp. 52FAK]